MLNKFKNKKGFSLVELIVVIAVLAVIAVILVPTITKYVENSRAQKDMSAMDEVVNAVQLSMSEQDCYDEMFRYSCTNNYITYTDSSGNYGQQLKDEEYWAPDGSGRATTITFNPIKDEFGKTYYSLDRAIINDMTYSNGSVAQSRTMEGSLIDDNQCYLKNATTSNDDVTAYVYNNVKKIAGGDIKATSATYKNSSYTIFIKFDKNGDTFTTTVTGAFNGTNLHEGAEASIGSHTSRYENDDPNKPIEEAEGGKVTATFTNSDLMGSGSLSGNVIDYKYDNGEYVEDSFMPMQDGQEYVVLDGTGSMSFVLLNDGSINIITNESVEGNIPAACIQKGNNTMTVVGTGTEYDGEYKFFTDGYVELYGEVVAKAKDRWVSLNNGNYLVVHENKLYASEDGNHVISLDVNLNTIGEAINSFIDRFEEDMDLLDAYGYPFTSYEDRLLLTHIYDFVAVDNIVNTNLWHWASRQQYTYWGGFAKDTETISSFATTAEWCSKVTMTETIKFYKVIGERKVLMRGTDIVDNGTYIMDMKEQYYYNGIKTDNIFFVWDHPFAYEDGMTYREWIESKYSEITLLDDLNGSECVYIPEENLDSLCGSYGIFGGLPSISCDEFRDGSAIYCSGTIYLNEPLKDYVYSLFKNPNYEYEGLWYGYGENIVTEQVKSYDIYNYFIRNGYSLDDTYYYHINMYPAFKYVGNQQTVDISNYIYKQYGYLYVSKNDLEEFLGFDIKDIDIEFIAQDNGCVIQTEETLRCYDDRDCYIYMSEIGPQFNTNKVGVIFEYNGIRYEGWVE